MKGAFTDKIKTEEENDEAENKWKKLKGRAYWLFGNKTQWQEFDLVLSINVRTCVSLTGNNVKCWRWESNPHQVTLTGF